MIVRPLCPSDLPEVERIEQGAMPAPWSEAQLRAEIGVAGSVALVATEGEALCGYAFFRTCLPECELLHLVVALEWRRRGVAATLLAQTLADFADQGYAACFLEVRASNAAARRLYEKTGFLHTGTRKRYYNQPVEDALLMSRQLIDEQREEL